MSDPTNDFGWWRWGLSIIGSMLGGAAVGGWVSRGMLESVKQQIATLKSDVSTLERDQSKCQATLKSDIKEIVQHAVKHAIDEHALRSAGHLESIRTELAVIVALHGETQKDVQAMFERLDRRRHEFSPTPKGERRDQ